MKASLFVLLLAGNLASAATEWTTQPQKTTAKTGDACTLTIDALVVTPTNSKDEYNQVTMKMNDLLSKKVLETAKVYFEAVGADTGSRCLKSRASGGLSAEITTILNFKTPAWSSWQQSSAGYLGGAHGYAQVDLLVLSDKGERITFDSVLAVTKIDFLKTIIAKLKAANRYNEDSFAIWMNGSDGLKKLNFSADDKGILIFFNSYEIASYADGPSEVSYTWEELKSILKKDSIFASQLK